MILFIPYGLRLNQMVPSRRWQKFIDGEYPEIKSIISLPRDIFEGILFHGEILIFNIEGLKEHYFYHDGKSLKHQKGYINPKLKCPNSVMDYENRM